MHSTSYQYYLKDKEAYELAKSEGKITKSQYGDDQFKSGNRMVYVKNLTNPYDGPDKPEMLRKSAGKSFLAPYMKVRNSEAAMKEAQSHEDVRDAALSGFDGDTVDGFGEEV